MARAIKKCQTCGNPFEASKEDYTVNCPTCRARSREKRYRITRSGDISKESRDYVEAKFICKTCGKSFKRGDAYKHRSETGHSF